MLLTVLCNVSPYIKSFALESCLKLLSLLDRCARPSYLFRSAFTHHGLIFLIEMLNNIAQYQFEGNAMLVYSVLRQKEVFHTLRDLELPAPSSKIMQRARQQQQQEAAGASEGTAAASSDAAPAPSDGDAE